MLKGYVTIPLLIVCTLVQFLHGGPGNSKSAKCISEENLVNLQEQDGTVLTCSDNGPNLLKIPIVPKGISKQTTILKDMELRPKFFITFMNRETSSLAYNSNFNELVSHYPWYSQGLSFMVNIVSEFVTLNGDAIDDDNNAVLGLLLFKKKKQYRVKHAIGRCVFVWYHRQGIEFISEASKIFPSNLIKEQTFFDQPAAYILFMPKPELVSNQLIQEIQKENRAMKAYLEKMHKKAPGRFALWGCEVYGSDLQSPRFTTMSSHFALSYYGPNIQSWSMVIDRRMTDLNIKEKMKKFKNVLNVHEGQRTIALNLQSTHISEPLRMTDEIFSEIFPETKLVTMNIKSDLEKYCIDNWMARYGELQNVQQQITHDWNYNCYLVIKYD